MALTEGDPKATVDRHLISVPTQEASSVEDVFHLVAHNERTDLYVGDVTIGDEERTVRVTIEALKGDLEGRKNIVLIGPGLIANEGLYTKLRHALAERGIPTATVKDNPLDFHEGSPYQSVRHPVKKHVNTGLWVARAIKAYTETGVVGAGHSESGFSLPESANIDPLAFEGMILLSPAGLEEFASIPVLNKIVAPFVLASRLPKLLGRDVGRSIVNGDIEITPELVLEELKYLINLGIVGVEAFSLSQANLGKTVTENRRNGVKSGVIIFDDDSEFKARKIEKRAVDLFDDSEVTWGFNLDHLAPINKSDIVAAFITRMMTRMDLLEVPRPSIKVLPSTIS